AQHEDRAADEMQQKRLALELALQLQLGPFVLGRLAARGLHRAVELELSLGVLIGDMAVIDLEMPDDRGLRALLRGNLLHDRGGNRARLLTPVELALVVALQSQLRLPEGELGH